MVFCYTIFTVYKYSLPIFTSKIAVESWLKSYSYDMKSLLNYFKACFAFILFIPIESLINGQDKLAAYHEALKSDLAAKRTAYRQVLMVSWMRMIQVLWLTYYNFLHLNEKYFVLSTVRPWSRFYETLSSHSVVELATDLTCRHSSCKLWSL